MRPNRVSWTAFGLGGWPIGLARLSNVFQDFVFDRFSRRRSILGVRFAGFIDRSGSTSTTTSFCRVFGRIFRRLYCFGVRAKNLALNARSSIITLGKHSEPATIRTIYFRVWPVAGFFRRTSRSRRHQVVAHRRVRLFFLDRYIPATASAQIER